MQYTPLMAEFQVTQEYLGHSNHLAYLAPMWKEFFNFVAPASLKAIAGVANIGTDVNWCGHTLHKLTGMLSDGWHGNRLYRLKKSPMNG